MPLANFEPTGTLCRPSQTPKMRAGFQTGAKLALGNSVITYTEWLLVQKTLTTAVSSMTVRQTEHITETRNCCANANYGCSYDNSTK